MKNLKRKMLLLTAMGFIAGSSLVAQNPQQQVPQQQTQPDIEFTDNDLEKVVEIQKEVQKINQEVQPSMIKAIEEVGLKTEKYMQINKAVQQKSGTDGFEEEDLKKYQSAQESIVVIQNDARKQMSDKIKEVGFSEQEYSQIYMAIQQDAELQQKIQELMGNS